MAMRMTDKPGPASFLAFGPLPTPQAPPILTISPLTTHQGAAMPEPEELTIAALGAQGDGVAETPGAARYVAFALPGERVAARGDGLSGLLSPPSPDRAEPVCRHYGRC